MFYAINKIGGICNLVHPKTPMEGMQKYYNEANCCSYLGLMAEFVPVENLRFYSVDSNIYLGISCLIVAIYKIKNFNNKNHILPKWIMILKYSAIVSTFLAFNK